MNRIKKLFESKKEGILSIYFTAGFPALNDTMRIIRYLDKYGADLIEIGMPFSDPIADGPVIQRSSQSAIEKGMNLELLFGQLADLREITQLPVLLMGYLNPVLQMGMPSFLRKCNERGIDGVIIPDLPPEVYLEEYKKDFDDLSVSNILLITPQTPEKRIRMIDSLSDGFLYLVSSYSTTGSTGEFTDMQISYFERIRAMKLNNPGLIGFGISGKGQFKKACKYSSGGIIGSSFIKAIDEKGELEDKIKNFIQAVKE